MPVSDFHRQKFMGLALAAALVTTVGLNGLMSKAHAQSVGADRNNAQDDEEVEDTFDTKFMKNLLSNFGLSASSSPGIDYHERSPLVVPPSLDLPPPENKSAAADPAWPKDPDMTRQKKTKRRMVPVNQQVEDELRPLTPAEMTPGTKRQRAESGAPSVSRSSDNSEGRADVLMPSQLGHEGFSLGSLFGGRDGKEVKFEKEPERAALTDPPIGLRTPSPRYVYGTKGKIEASKKIGEDRGVDGVENQ